MGHGWIKSKSGELVRIHANEVGEPPVSSGALFCAVSKWSQSGMVHKWRRVADWWYSECGLSEKHGDLQPAAEGIKTCRRCWKAQNDQALRPGQTQKNI